MEFHWVKKINKNMPCAFMTVLLSQTADTAEEETIICYIHTFIVRLYLYVCFPFNS